MTVREKIRNWFGAPQSTSMPAAMENAQKKDADTPAAVTMPGIAEQTSAQVVLSPEEHARLKFTMAVGEEERSAVLTTHSFFEHGKNVAQLDAPLLMAVMEHMTQMYSEHASTYFYHEYDDYDNSIRERLPHTCQLIVWGTPPNFLSWQTRALELARQVPQDKHALLEHVAEHLKKTIRANDTDETWFFCAEKLAEQGVFLPLPIMLGAIKKASSNHVAVSDFLTKYPMLAQLWNDAKNDTEALEWAVQSMPMGLWLAQHHARINAWDLAEIWHKVDADPNRPMLVAVADSTRSGALLKAWYGVEPSADEVIKHSLYVHKYAPMYLEEVKPLPTSWQVAMSLATTGREFCDTLLTTAQAQLSQVDPLSLELPDLGPSGP